VPPYDSFYGCTSQSVPQRPLSEQIRCWRTTGCDRIFI